MTARSFLGNRVQLSVSARSVGVGIGMLAVIAVVVVATLATGEHQLPVGNVVAALAGSADPATNFIVLNLRLPRVLVALGVGVALGVSGGIFQSITRNPLGSPDIIGFTWGASAAAVAAILVFGVSAFGLSAAAIAGGTITALLVYVLASRRGVPGYRLILVGIALSAMLMAVVHYLLSRASITEAGSAQVWLIGSLHGRSGEQVALLWGALVVLLPLVTIFGRRLDIIEMGDVTAKSLGVRVERSRLILIVLAVFLAGSATAAAGPIGFVALAAPQLARRLTRGTGAQLTPAALMGALLTVAGDLAAQRFFGTELPVGMLTAAIGGLYLAWLLRR